jgi:CelD/BcsL family acetyltransferase involved in cellulose biosynthesis
VPAGTPDIGRNTATPTNVAHRLGRIQDEVLLERTESASEWEDACARCTGATAFHRHDFLHSVAPLIDCEFVPLMVRSGEQVVGVAPLLVKRLGPFCSINWVPFPYLGPLVPPELIPATLSALSLRARRLRAINHQQSFAEVVPDGTAGGFTPVTGRTFIVPLAGRSDHDLLASMHSTRRQQISRAQRHGFEVCPAEPADFQLMELWAGQVFAGQGLPPAYPDGTYAQMFSLLNSAPGSAFHAVRLDGQTVAVDISFISGGRAFGWQGGVNPSCRSKHPQVLLVWHRLQWARSMGAIEFDMVGAPNEGIAQFKRHFGALERPYTVLLRQARPHRIAQSALARLKSRQPTPG